MTGFEPLCHICALLQDNLRVKVFRLACVGSTSE